MDRYSDSEQRKRCLLLYTFSFCRLHEAMVCPNKTTFIRPRVPIGLSCIKDVFLIGLGLGLGTPVLNSYQLPIKVFQVSTSSSDCYDDHQSCNNRVLLILEYRTIPL